MNYSTLLASDIFVHIFFRHNMFFFCRMSVQNFLMIEPSSSFHTWCWSFGKFLNLVRQPDIIIIFFISEASVNLECISWKIGFCVAPTKDRDSIFIYLLSTTGRGPCSYLMLKGNLRLPPIREMRRSINRVKRRIIFCFSRTWQDSIQQRKRHNKHRNKPGQKRYI